MRALEIPISLGAREESAPSFARSLHAAIVTNVSPTAGCHFVPAGTRWRRARVREPGNIHHRVLDLFLDVYGFNLTYEMLEANESMRADPCLGHHCSFTGVCLAAADWSRYSCACLGDFYGDECQFSPRCGPDSAARSSSSLCNNGGTCRYYIGSKTQTCICPPEYKGSRCEYLVRPEQVLAIGKDTLASVADVIQHCRTFETLKARRITPKFGRLANVTTVASVDVPPTSPCDLASMIRQIVREELGRRDAVNPPRAPAINTSPPYDAMCAAVDATLYDVPQSRAPEPPTDNLHHRRGFQNASRQPPTMVSSWDDHAHMAPRGRFGDVREAPVCYNCGFRGHVARFCGQRRRPQQRYYEGPSPSSRQNRWRGGMRSMRDAYDGDGFQQTIHSDTHVGRNFHRNLRNDSPSSV
ncbi:hypothetical protein HPB51_006514 [Rhipicephalus microplus]|uniref:Uncharacterized protein n=1 Tax=Rhipicephalus microplus TaxID=6941 RepID=A0A9J6E749_RHIMP|nr:hypothetical protein HPB51_006514 [Rhipicephalus microplus]